MLMRRLIIYIYSVTLQFAFCFAVQAEESVKLFPPDVTGRGMWQQGFLRIIYYTDGEHAVPGEDADKNGIPDFVEDISKQLRVAHHVLCEISGFRNPLESTTDHHLEYVEAYIYSRGKLNGNAGVSYNKSSPALAPANPGARSLRIGIANDTSPRTSMTATHEYFHQIQNGMTNISNRWFYEGMARWSDDSLAERKSEIMNRADLIAMLEDPAEQAELFSMVYNAAPKLWIPLGNLCPQASTTLPDNDPFLSLTYSDGTPVIKDRIFKGAAMMKAVLEGVAAVERTPFNTYRYGEWSRKNKRNDKNNQYILGAVRQAVDNLCP